MWKLDESLKLDKYAKMPWKMSWKNHDEECANWLILELQLKEQNPKLESIRKFEPERLFQEFLLLVNGQRKCQSQLKIKVNGQGQKLARSGLVPGCSGWVTYWAVEMLMSSYVILFCLCGASCQSFNGKWRVVCDVTDNMKMTSAKACVAHAYMY